MSRFADRVALVTGGSRGIGRAVVEALAREGAKVAFVYHSNADAANDVVSTLAGEGHNDVWAVQCDVADKAACDQVVSDLVEKWEKIDVLVNNAGVIRDGLLMAMDEEDWKTVINTNLGSVYNFCHAVVPLMMRKRYGRIVNMSSVSAEFGNPGQANYAASKGGVQGITRCLAAELGKRKITVNAVAPGFISTDMTEAVRNLAEDKILSQISLKRLGAPEDIAAATLFLASEDAGYITGQILTVDGGLSLGGM